MVIQRYSIFLFLLLFTLYVPVVKALSVGEFINICHASPGECSDHPVLTAYVGGALDLLATLNERTDYLESIYCKEPKELFDVPLIISFMEKEGEQYSNDNAMWLLLKYFEVYGGCES